MLNYHVKIGLVPIRRDCTPRPGIFNWEYAEDRARKTVAYIEEHFTSENVSFVDLKSINEVEVLYNEKDVQPVVDLMRKERADAIFIINSNFGNEEVAAMVTKELGLESYRVVSNIGEQAGQSVPHLHFHGLSRSALGAAGRCI